MPPKVKITKEDIVSAAVESVREKGADAINAREIADRLTCSTQPVFSNFSSMEDVKLAVLEEARSRYGAFVRRETESGKYPPYKAMGIAYICFADEERELFKLLFMRDRSGEVPPGDEAMEPVYEQIRDQTGLSADLAKRFHLTIWAAIHGIAVMIATNYVALDRELISQITTDCYQGLRKQYAEKE